MTAVVDSKTSEQIRPPTPPEASAIVAVDRNKWFIIALMLSLIILIQAFYNNRLSQQAIKNTEVLYIKMYSDGRSEMATSAPDDVQQFYVRNIDKHITDYVSYRWDERPSTIREDYGRALLFMGTELAGTFQSPQGYFAADKAAKLSTALDADTTTYHVDLIDHYDKKTMYEAGGKRKTDLYRTNVYLTKSVTGAHGEIKGKPEKYILQLDWRLAIKDELKDKNKDFFMVNALGVVIEEEHMNLSPQSAQPESATTN